MSNTDRDSMLERWADGMEKLEQYYEGIYGPPATPPSLPPITTYDAMLEAIADGMERAKRNINKKSPTYHSDSVVYVKTVPAGNVHYASIEQIGGRTLVWNQLGATTFREATVNGIIFAKVSSEEGSLSGNCSTANFYTCFYNNACVVGHKYLVNVNMTTPYSGVRIRAYSTASASGEQSVICTANGTTMTADVYFNTGVVSTNYKPQIFDLTLLYGSGNEPTTVAEFQQTFPAVWYAFNKGTLLSAGVTEVVSKDANDTTLQAVSIPAEVQALEGYGLSTGAAYNYIDFEAKKFVQNVGFVDLSTLTFGYGPTVGWSATLPNVKNPADDDTAFNGLSATLKVTDRNTQATAFSGGTDAGMVSVAGGKVYVGTGSISIVPSGTLIYELDEPVETDISAYLTDDGLIEVEVGGTLTFPNQNGDDYRIPVPSSVTFVVGEP